MTIKHSPEVTSNEAQEHRHAAGWRAGKPLEDPEKMKRWGFVSAKPSEFLVCTREGRVDARRSGQGARIFKWPWEQVAVVPTTIQHMDFVADQVTRERVGVRVTGVAVYRIARPELACRLLNFTYAERASEKLARTLAEMFVGAARRLIANLSLEDCLTRRKEAIAGFLMEEIAPVLAGRGADEDSTDQGWGVVIDTIEIQDVRILSSKVFEHLQAPFRAEIATRAELAELQRQRQVAERRAEAERRDAEEAAAVVTRRHQLAEEQELCKLRAERLRRATAAAAEAEALAAEAAVLEARHQAQLRALELEQQRQAFAQGNELRLKGDRLQAELGLREGELKIRAAEQAQAQQEQRAAAEIEQLLSQGRALRELINHALPQMAAALKQDVATLHYTHLGSGEGPSPLAPLASGLGQVLALARGLGLQVPQ